MLSAIAVMAACVLQSARAANRSGRLCLVRNGQPEATIIVDRLPTRATQLAAAELQYHVQKITGAVLPIVDNEADAVGSRILVGESDATRRLGIAGSEFRNQEYLIQFRPGSLVLIGRDKDDRGKIDYAEAQGLPGNFDEQGTCYATYDFLEKHCDVRWFGPTETEMVYPAAKTLEVGGPDVRRAPAFRFRWQSFSPYRKAKILWDEPSTKDMTLYQRRLKYGGLTSHASHSFYGYYDRFWAQNPNNPGVFAGKRPEYFAQGQEGQPSQPCFSNPGFTNEVLKDARDYFDGKGSKVGACNNGDYFSLVPMDNSLFCKCPACLPQLDMSEVANEQFSKGYASDYVYGFANKIAREIGKEYPGRYLATLAYEGYAYHPKNVQIEPNIAVTMCLHTRNWWSGSVKRNDMKIYNEWIAAEKGRRPLAVWLYYCFPDLLGSMYGFTVFPGFFAHTVAKQVRMFHRDGIVGALTDGDGEQVDSYVTMKLLDDPTQDVDKILDEFFSRYYGASAKPMKQLYFHMEETFMNSKNYPAEVNTANKHFHQTEEIAWGHLGTTERMTKWARLMKRAKSMARTDVEKKRVSMFDDGVWRPMWAAHVKHNRRTVEKARVEALRAQEPPSVRVPLVRTGADGDVSGVDWAKGALLGDWHTIDGYSTDHQASARILHDGKYLYMQFTEAVPDSSKLSGGVYNEDHLELFFGWQRAKPYRQAGIAPSGDFHNQTIGAGDGSWTSGAKIVSDRSRKDRWTVSMSFPMNAFLAGGVSSGSTFYGNFVRGASGDDNLSWSPLFGNGFHVPERMGRIALD